jgi:hypothetical protein
MQHVNYFKSGKNAEQSKSTPNDANAQQHYNKYIEGQITNNAGQSSTNNTNNANVIQASVGNKKASNSNNQF